ncbi:MAG: cell division protein ZapA, partial [Flavipsychrobacter sp.]
PAILPKPKMEAVTNAYNNVKAMLSTASPSDAYLAWNTPGVEDIKPDEEETVRKAVKQADEKIQELRSHYAGKDDQDFIAMCLVSYAADIAIDNAFNPVVQQDLADMIKKIDSALEG